ncbi:MAG: 6-phosphogluconolactonase [Pyrinomonadaceae bacterium]
MNKYKIEIVTDADNLSRRAAEIFVDLASRAINEHGIFSVALSGGSTPKKLYALLAAEPFRSNIEWTNAHFFFGDERNVPPGSDESNFRMANEALFSKISELPPENIHRVAGEKAAVDAAGDYEQELKDFFRNELPRFDLVLLGLGADGHTASLFPDSPALEENVRWFVENWVEKFNSYRLTLTFPVLNNALTILFLVAGADKSEVLAQVLHGSEKNYPSQMINPTGGELRWLIDQAAAADEIR